ncbi:hypothetical protein Hanom_Chr01g00055041 [Helianthus anomalus]
MNFDSILDECYRRYDHRTTQNEARYRHRITRPAFHSSWSNCRSSLGRYGSGENYSNHDENRTDHVERSGSCH